MRQMSGPDNSSSAPAETMRSVNMTPRWRMHVGLHGCLGGRTPTQETEGVVSQNVVAIAFNNDVANAGGTTWVPGSNPGGSAIRRHSSAGAEKQLRNVASMTFIYKWVAAMPDVHWGIGATVGSVIPTKGAIIPAAVGVDIGCGMIAVQTTLTANHLPDNLKSLRTAIEKA